MAEPGVGPEASRLDGKVAPAASSTTGEMLVCNGGRRW